MMDVNHNELIEELAIKLKDVAVAPEWAAFAKTGHGKQRPPTREDWWQVRTAAVLLSVRRLGPVGVSKLSVKYANRKNRGMRPEKLAKASRNVLRKVLQQLEAAKYVEQVAKDTHKGRVVTKTGERLIIEASKAISKSSSKKQKE